MTADPITRSHSGPRTAAPAMEITIESRAGTATFACPDGESILYAGLASGLTLPYDCATGTCGMCRARVRSGTVETRWAEAPALAKLQRDKGDILMCQARATSACVLRVPANVVSTPAASHPRHTPGTVVSAVRLTGDVIHFDIALAHPMAFAAGQFVVLSVPGVPGGRSYSMVNYARMVSALELVIKRKPDGGLSNWMFEADRTGTPVDVFGPLGRAVFKPGEDRDMVAITGGSGIAGIMSILEHAGATGHFKHHRGQVFFGVRTLADGFYLDRLSRLAEASHGNLDVVLAVSHEPVTSPTHPGFPAIRIAHGFVHDVAEAEFKLPAEGLASFVAGPPPMVDGAIRVLLGRGVPAASIRYDKFS